LAKHFYLIVVTETKQEIEMKIKKVCSSLKQAEKKQDALYNKYNSVELVKSPLLFSEAGEYVWEVSGKLSEDEQDDIFFDIHADRTPI
jgi:hypothetical protein